MPLLETLSSAQSCQCRLQSIRRVFTLFVLTTELTANAVVQASQTQLPSVVPMLVLLPQDTTVMSQTLKLTSRTT